MPVHHEIDQKHQLIISSWSGEASDDEFIQALTRYQIEVRGHGDYQHYNELLDFRDITTFNLTTKGLIEMGRIARKTDRNDMQTRLALVVKTPLGFGLARMYITYRNLEANSHKILKVFKNKTDALSWLSRSSEPTESEP